MFAEVPDSARDGCERFFALLQAECSNESGFMYQLALLSRLASRGGAEGPLTYEILHDIIDSLRPICLFPIPPRVRSNPLPDVYEFEEDERDLKPGRQYVWK